jgi:3-demethoxyubiquinol 3-hydroxylase
MPINYQDIAKIIRVDQAGEYGAKRIYEGQLRFCRDPKLAKKIKSLRDSELPHLAYFDNAINERRVRPTILNPIWNIGGFLLGAVTMKMGREAAMLCTEAVEEVIEEHYQEQIDFLGDAEPELANKIKEFQADEIEHKNTAIELGSKNTPAYKILKTMLRGITKQSIWLAKRF